MLRFCHLDNSKISEKSLIKRVELYLASLGSFNLSNFFQFQVLPQNIIRSLECTQVVQCSRFFQQESCLRRCVHTLWVRENFLITLNYLINEQPCLLMFDVVLAALYRRRIAVEKIVKTQHLLHNSTKIRCVLTELEKHSRPKGISSSRFLSWPL